MLVRNCSGQIGAILLCALSAGAFSGADAAQPSNGAQSAAGAQPSGATAAEWSIVQKNCTECHNSTDWAGSVAFDTMSPDQVPADAKVWEDAIQTLRGGFMPPPCAPSRRPISSPLATAIRRGRRPSPSGSVCAPTPTLAPC